MVEVVVGVVVVVAVVVDPLPPMFDILYQVDSTRLILSETHPSTFSPFRHLSTHNAPILLFYTHNTIFRFEKV